MIELDVYLQTEWCFLSVCLKKAGLLLLGLLAKLSAGPNFDPS